MTTRTCKIMFAALLAALTFSSAAAQVKVDAGLAGSARGAGVTVDIYGKGAGEFTTVNVLADLHGLVTGDDVNPGIKANVTRNFVISSSWISGGGRFLVYGGPGITGGYVRDIGKEAGPVAALSGHLGLSFLFENLSFSLGMTGDLGMHLGRKGLIDRELSIYKGGIFHSLIPQVRIMTPLGSRRLACPETGFHAPSRVFFAVEQGILSTFFERFDNTYINSDGARNSYSGSRTSGHINSLMLMSLGYRINEFYAVRLSTGYAGIHDGARNIPLMLGGVYSRRGYGSGAVFFADAGPGFCGSASRSVDFVSRAGCGRRFSLGGGSKSLDINLSVLAAFYRPDRIRSKYSDEIIIGDKILDSGSWIFGPALTLAFNI